MKHPHVPSEISKPTSIPRFHGGIRAVLAALSLCFCLLLTPAKGAVFTIQDGIPATTLVPVSVPVSFSGFSEGTGVQFSVSWDPNILSYQSHSWNSALLGENIVVGSNVGSGQMGLTYTRPNQFGIDSAVLLTISFNALDVGNSPLNFVDTPTLRAISPATSTATWDSGSVEVVPEPVNVALGAFAGLVVVGSSLRRFLVRRTN